MVITFAGEAMIISGMSLSKNGRIGGIATHFQAAAYVYSSPTDTISMAWGSWKCRTELLSFMTSNLSDMKYCP